MKKLFLNSNLILFSSFFFVSKCDEHWAETVSAVIVAVATTETERSSVRTIIAITPTEEERTVRVREVRVVA